MANKQTAAVPPRGEDPVRHLSSTGILEGISTGIAEVPMVVGRRFGAWRLSGQTVVMFALLLDGTLSSGGSEVGFFDSSANMMGFDGRTPSEQSLSSAGWSDKRGRSEEGTGGVIPPATPATCHISWFPFPHLVDAVFLCLMMMVILVSLDPLFRLSPSLPPSLPPSPSFSPPASSALLQSYPLDRASHIINS